MSQHCLIPDIPEALPLMHLSLVMASNSPSLHYTDSWASVRHLAEEADRSRDELAAREVALNNVSSPAGMAGVACACAEALLHAGLAEAQHCHAGPQVPQARSHTTHEGASTFTCLHGQSWATLPQLTSQESEASATQLTNDS